jgi:hypothetical protein
LTILIDPRYGKTSKKRMKQKYKTKWKAISAE